MKTFKFRLLLYLLLVGSIPLFFAVYVFYGQSVQHAEEETENNIKHTHQQVLQMMHRELDQLDYLAASVNADFLIQSHMESSRVDSTASQEIFKTYVDRMFNIHVENLSYVKHICISIQGSGTSICSDFNLLNIEAYPVNSSDRKYQIYNINDSSLDFGLVAPLFNIHSDIVFGYIVVVLDFSMFLSDIQAMHSLEKQMIFNQDGLMIYSSEKQASPLNSFEGMELVFTEVHNDRLVNQMLWNRFNLSWYSRIELKNEWLTSSWMSLQTTLIVFCIVLILISVTSSIIFARYITRPIHNLRSLMKRAELGDLKAYWTSSSSQEMNDLGESYNQMLNRLEDLIKQVKWEAALKKEAEIEALRYQLNPHFLYNTLNTIKWVAKIHKTPQISEVVSSLVRLLQASLGKKGDFITIREEIALIEDYMEIQAFRYGDNVKVEYDIDPLSMVCLIPRMLMQPLVENALIHGIEPNNKQGVITIKVWLDRDLLMCQVEDNGKGIAEKEINYHEASMKKTSVKEKMSGIGLKHIREKIKLYYGADYKMFIFNKEETKGTVVRLSLPIHRNEE